MFVCGIKEHNFFTLSTCYLIKSLENWTPYFPYSLQYLLIDIDAFKFLKNYFAGLYSLVILIFSHRSHMCGIFLDSKHFI